MEEVCWTVVFCGRKQFKTCFSPTFDVSFLLLWCKSPTTTVYIIVVYLFLIFAKSQTKCNKFYLFIQNILKKLISWMLNIIKKLKTWWFYCGSKYYAPFPFHHAMIFIIIIINVKIRIRLRGPWLISWALKLKIM